MNLIPFVEYKVQLEFVTPLGSVGHSNIITVVRQYHDVDEEDDDDSYFDSPFNNDINKQQQQQQQTTSDESIESEEEEEEETTTATINGTTQIQIIETTENKPKMETTDNKPKMETTENKPKMETTKTATTDNSKDSPQLIINPIREGRLTDLKLKLQNVTIDNDKTYLYLVDESGNLKPGNKVQGHIEWTTSDDATTTEKLEFNKNLGQNNEIELDASIPPSALVQVVLKDDFGYSLKSNQIKATCKGNDCLGNI
jgi:hypothetical protein